MRALQLRGQERGGSAVLQCCVEGNRLVICQGKLVQKWLSCSDVVAAFLRREVPTLLENNDDIANALYHIAMRNMCQVPPLIAEHHASCMPFHSAAPLTTPLAAAAQ
jgi:hypothetical protein